MPGQWATRATIREDCLVENSLVLSGVDTETSPEILFKGSHVHINVTFSNGPPVAAMLMLEAERPKMKSEMS